MDFIFRMVTVTEFFQHPVIEFPVEKLGIIHRFIGQENTYRKEYDRCHPHATKWQHHILFNKLSSKIIQQKKYDEKYNGEDQGKTNPPFTNNRSEWGADQKKDQAGDGHGNFFVPCHQVISQVTTIIFITDSRNISAGFYAIDS
jgi:hypothetical protein